MPADLINGLGGPAGFGEYVIQRNDDASTYVDFRDVFPAGFNFAGKYYAGLYVSMNGVVSFAAGTSAYTPEPFPYTSNPMIAAFWADVDTRNATIAPEVRARATLEGTSTGANRVWLDLDAATHTVTITWDDVGFFSLNNSTLNAFQMRLSMPEAGMPVNLGGPYIPNALPGTALAEFRYEDINWLLGSASNNVARSGFDAGNRVDFFTLQGSGVAASMAALETTRLVGGAADETGVARLVLSNRPDHRDPRSFYAGERTAVFIEDSETQVPYPRLLPGEQNGFATVRVFLNANVAFPATIRFETVDGSAIAGQDYVAQSGVLDFSAGPVQEIRVALINDATPEPDLETFRIRLFDAQGVVMPDQFATLYLFDDDGGIGASGADALFSLSAPARVREGSGGSTALVTVNLGQALGVTASVDYATRNFSAVAGEDFTPVSGTLIFAPGETSKTIAVPILADGLWEGDEAFIVDLSNPIGALLPDGLSATRVTILNDDEGFLVRDLSRLESSPTGSFAIELTKALTVASSVRWTLEDGTASFANDVAPGARTGVVTFLAGETRKIVPITLANDSLVEGAETLTIRLSDATGAGIARGAANLTIMDDDGAAPAIELAYDGSTPTATPGRAVAITSITVAEGHSGLTYAAFTVTAPSTLTRPLTLDWTALPGTAGRGTDFYDHRGSLSFAPGDLVKTILVPIVGDGIAEGNEAFTIRLDNPSIWSALPKGFLEATATIIEGAPTFTLSALNATRAEGNGGSTAFTFAVLRSGLLGTTEAIGWSVAGSGTSPANAADFVGGVLPSGTVVFGPNETSKVITVQVAGDTAAEPTETFTVSLARTGGPMIREGAAIGTILRDDPNQAPTITSAATARFQEFGTGIAYQATGYDVEAAPLRWTLGGTDRALFTLDPATGALRFLAAPDGKAPADAGGDNVYAITVTASDGEATTTQAVALTVTDRPDAPVITSARTAGYVSGERDPVAYQATAFDDEGDTVTWSISGTDAALFNVDATTGAVTFKVPPQHLAPIDAGGDNVYDIVVTAADGRLSGSAPVSIIVTSANEWTPQANFGGGLGVREGTTSVVFQATGYDGDGTSTFIWTLGGTDADAFTLDAATGELRFREVPDFEAPRDADGNNWYDLVFTVSDGKWESSTPYVILVSNVNESPAVIGTPPALRFAVNVANAIDMPAGIFTDPDFPTPGDPRLEGHATYSATLADGSALPGWLGIDVPSGRFLGLPAPEDAGQYTVRVTLRDQYGLSASTDFTLTVVPNPPLTGDLTLSWLPGLDAFLLIDGLEDAEGIAGVTYRWRVSEPDAFAWNDIPGATDIALAARADIAGKDIQVYATTTDQNGFVEGTSSYNALGRAGTGLADIIDTTSMASGSPMVLLGLGGNDLLTTGFANDTLDGGAGADTMTGGEGNDTYVVDNIRDLVVETSDSDIDTVISFINHTLNGGTENLTLSGAARRGAGNESDNVITGNGLTNVLTGADGFDTVRGLGGNDTIIGSGYGADLLDGGEGIDLLSYEGDSAGVDANIAFGQGYAGSALGSVLIGFENLLGGRGDDTLRGDERTNRVAGEDGNDILNGDAGDDVLSGGAGDDSLIGGMGADRLDGGQGADRMEGGAGNDTYLVDDALDSIWEAADGGYDRVMASIDAVLAAEVERLSLAGMADLNGTGNGLANRLDGNAAANILDGDAGDDSLYGLGGNDTLIGGAGNDRLDGGLGQSRLEGGDGDDTYIVSTSADAVVEQAGGGYDRVLASISYTLNAEVERLSLMGTANLAGAGNEIANRLDGNTGDNLLTAGRGNDSVYGGAGADTLIGGEGRDVLLGGAAPDVFRFLDVSDSPAGSARRDTIGDFSLAENDMIDLSEIDADSALAGNQAFAWIGTSAFGSLAGQLRYARGMLAGDVDGDGIADFELVVSGTPMLSAAAVWL